MMHVGKAPRQPTLQENFIIEHKWEPTIYSS
jgi:hypothetical protein